MSLRELTLSGIDPLLAPHLVMRGTYLPGTVRCTSGDRFRLPLYLSNYEEYADAFSGAKDGRSFKCYVDVRVSSYIVGQGPAILTIMRMWMLYLEDWYGSASADAEDGIERFRQFLETGIEGAFQGLDDILPGNEEILLLGPPIDLSVEVWQWWGSLGVERREDGVVVATNPHKPLWERYRPDDYQMYRSALEMELPAFRGVVAEANEARVEEYSGRIGADPSLPMLITDAHRLREFFIDAGAYDHPDGPPAQPPPVPALQ